MKTVKIAVPSEVPRLENVLSALVISKIHNIIFFILTVTIRSHRVQLCNKLTARKSTRSHSCIRCGHSLITQEFPVIVSPYPHFAQLTFTIMSNYLLLFVTQHNNNTLPTILGESLEEESN